MLGQCGTQFMVIIQSTRTRNSLYFDKNLLHYFVQELLKYFINIITEKNELPEIACREIAVVKIVGEVLSLL